MAGPGLSTTNSVGTGDPPGDANKVAGILNKFDTTIVATTAGHVPISDGTTFDNRALLSTDNPGVVVNTQTGSTYTLVLSDAGKRVERNNASANTLTVPPNSSVAFPVGTVILVRQYGAGVTTLTPGAGVTLRSRGGLLNTAGTYAGASIEKRATDEWCCEGDLA